MYDAVLACGRWLENTPWGVTVRDSAWMYPVMLWVHFVGLSMWLGASLTVDLRLMGVGARRQTAVDFRTACFRGSGSGLASPSWGISVFSAEATTYVTNTGFCLKLAVLTPLALIWHLVVQKNTRAVDPTEQLSAIGKWAGFSSSCFGSRW